MDKMIHSNEFRLRVLLTNGCNENCDFCLNDFQKKDPIEYAYTFDLLGCIRAYGQFMKSIEEKSIITFSGGEPGLHPNLDIILAHAKHYCDVVKVVTNGLALNENLYKFVDKWHIGVRGRRLFLPDLPNMLVQMVVTDDMSQETINDIVTYYQKENIPVKLFVDFFSKDKQSLYKKIFNCPVQETRFTGHQINRGNACEGCKHDCVTLKALWYFPDGSSSTCPQGLKEPYDDDSWDETMEKAYAAHKI